MANEIELDLNDTAPPKKNKAALANIENTKNQSDSVDATELLLPVMLELGIRADLTPTELFSLGIEYHNGAMVLAVKAGIAFMAAQKGLTESVASELVTFKSWIESNGLTEQRVYETIRLAKAYIAIPADQRKSFISLGKYKAIKLAKLDDNQINDLITQDPDALDEFALMSRDDMKRRILNLETNFTKVNAEKEILQRAQKRTNKPGDLAYDPRTFEVRHESASLEYAARTQIDALEVLFNAVQTEPASSEQEQDLRVAAIAAATGAMLQRCNALYTRMANALGDFMPLQAANQYMLTTDEIEALKDSVLIINASFNRKKEDRIAERNADAPPQRGRPVGSKNKTGEA